MLFASKINQVSTTIANISQEIEDLQKKIEWLRGEKLQLEQYQQQLGSAENAAESAIEQIKTALMMITAISPTEAQTFKGAIDSLFDCERPQLAACSEPVESDPVPVPEPEPSGKPDSSTPLSVNVEVVAEDVSPEVLQGCEETEGNQDISDEDVSPQGPKSDIAYYKIEQLPFNKLRALAKHRKVSGKGDAHDLIKRIFESGITPEEVEDFRSSVA